MISEYGLLKEATTQIVFKGPSSPPSSVGISSFSRKPQLLVHIRFKSISPSISLRRCRTYPRPNILLFTMLSTQPAGFIIAFLSFCCLLVSSTPTPNKLQPLVPRVETPSHSVYINNITYNGNGCLSGSGSVKMAIIPGSENAEITYTSHVARTGSAIPSRDNIVGCSVAFTLNYPRGKTFASYASTVSGDITLAPTVDASRGSTYKSTGQQEVSFRSSWPLGYNGGYSVTDQVALVVDPNSCPETTQTWFELGTTVGLPYSREAYGQINVLKQVLVFDWDACLT